MECPAVTIDNSVIVSGSGALSFGAEQTHQCIVGYEFTDSTQSQTITCQANKTWSGMVHTECQSKNIVLFISFVFAA